MAGAKPRKESGDGPVLVLWPGPENINSASPWHGGWEEGLSHREETPVEEGSALETTQEAFRMSLK